MDLAAQAGEREKAQEAALAQSGQPGADGGSGPEESAYVPDSGEELTVAEALKITYRLLSVKEINAVTSDQINFDGEGTADPSSGSAPSPGPDKEADEGNSGESVPASGDAEARPGSLAWVWAAAGIVLAAAAVFVFLMLRGKDKGGKKDKN